MKRKFMLTAGVAALLWIVVLVQVLITRIYVSQTDLVQAFTQNQLTVTGVSGDTRNTKEGNRCLESRLAGRMDTEEMAKLAERLFRTMGGACVLDSEAEGDENYYVAYGYTSGISETKKINGKRINLNVAMSYDEKQDCTCVVMGTPLVNSDF